MYKKKICAVCMSCTFLIGRVAHAEISTNNIYDILKKDGIVTVGSMFNTDIFGLSADGNTAIGFDTQGGEIFAAIWDSSKGEILLPKFGIYTSAAEATGITADKKYISGYVTSPTGGAHAVYWDDAYKIHLLNNLNTNNGAGSNAADISADGTIIVGQATTSKNRDNAVYWIRADGSIHSINQLGDESMATAVDSYGKHIVGSTSLGSDPLMHAFRWTSKTGMVALPDLAGLGGNALSISDTGRIAGISDNASAQNRAVYWGSDNLIHDLGTLLPENSGWSRASNISRLGTVISGSSDIGGGNALGFIWKEGKGMHSVNDWLKDANVNPGNLKAISVNTMSSDGSTIAGLLSNRNAYVARVMAIKEEPSPLLPPVVKPTKPKPDGSGIVSVIQVNQSMLYVQQSMELQRQATVQAADNADCATFGPNGMCVKVNADVRNRNDDIGEYTNPSATITIAKQLQEHGRAGLSVTELHSHIKNDIGTKIEQTAPIFTAFIGYGNDPALGWKGYAGISVLNAPIDIDRAYYNGADKEWGYGKTRARSLNYQIRGGYTFQPNSHYQVTPFVTLSYNDTKWNGYQETGDGAFLASFSNQRSRVSTLHIGINNQYQIDDKNSMGITLGLRKNLHTNNSIGRASVLNGFGGLATQYQIEKISKVMPELESNYSYTLDKNQKISVYAGYRNVGVGAGEVNGGMSYELSF
ncbi:autotransporter domain-containing protein [Edwardsiella tarda]|uniref:autotransporter domain-containing protein n=1 Tax=Edwardsiella tarda TaxID=636 RepID=UPI003A867782